MTSSTRRSSLAMAWIVLTVLTLQAGCGGTEPAAEPDRSESPPSAPAESPSAPPTGLAAEPILYSDAGFSYPGFRLGPLTDLHAELSEMLGERIQMRVIPYVESDDATGEMVLKGETLELWVQQPDTDPAAMRERADRMITAVERTFPDLGERYSVQIHARLPEGSTVADLEPELAEACGDNNLVQTGVYLDEYETGNPEELFYALCQGLASVDPYFMEEGWDHLPGAWRTTDADEG